MTDKQAHFSGKEQEMTETQIETIENYFFILQTIAERANDEFTEAIKQICKDAMNYMWQFHDEEN